MNNYRTPQHFFNNTRTKFPFVARTRRGALKLTGSEQEKLGIGAAADFPTEDCNKWAFARAEDRDAFRVKYAAFLVKAS